MSLLATDHSTRIAAIVSKCRPDGVEMGNHLYLTQPDHFIGNYSMQYGWNKFAKGKRSFFSCLLSNREGKVPPDAVVVYPPLF